MHEYFSTVKGRIPTYMQNVIDKIKVFRRMVFAADRKKTGNCKNDLVIILEKILSSTKHSKGFLKSIEELRRSVKT